MKVPYYNGGKTTIVIGCVSIAPGVTRPVDATMIPNAVPQTPEEPPAPADPLATMLDGTVAEIVAALPNLSFDELQRLQTLEQEGKGRTTLLEAINTRLIELAAAEA